MQAHTVQRCNVAAQRSSHRERDEDVLFRVVPAGGEGGSVGAVEASDGEGTGFGGPGLAAVVVDAGGGGDVAGDGGDGEGKQKDRAAALRGE